MRQRDYPSTHTRPSAVALLLALFAMLLQAMVSAAHLSAEAAAVVGGPTGERLGFLEICSAEGLRRVSLDPSGRTGQGPEGPHEVCPVCASLSGAEVVTGTPQAAPFHYPLIVVDVLLPSRAIGPMARDAAKHVGSSRSPPATANV